MTTFPQIIKDSPGARAWAEDALWKALGIAPKDSGTIELAIRMLTVPCEKCNGHGRLPITPRGELPRDHDRDCDACQGEGVVKAY